MKPRIALFALLFSLLSLPLQAAPKLTLISADRQQVLDRDQLEALPQTTIVTTSPYFEGTATFTGPTLARVLDALGVSGRSQATFLALNDYRVSGSLDELLSLDAIVATRKDGQAMSVRDRGPFWIMLPLSERPELDDPLYHRFMVWQLSGIELE
ncbi:hypothetical protein [uncultured Marinobacter sp.]|uniref:hypothetical protein n=1 Tax=uncultured Marinobacter sp. TaxID=187379 RepID=UPI002352AD80|tara:strand:+ start:5748 stop:6212 length:465 start_codon:yes stop_codon:yes gene_type:complete